MDFAWTAEQQAYRTRLKDIVQRELPANWWEDYAHDGPYPPKFMQFARGFSKVLAKEKLIVRHWPKEYGGVEADAWDHIISSEEMWPEGEPRSSLYMGANWAGPAIMKFGTEEQKLTHLRAIAHGEVLWCQGFSEPEAGSDLASLRTKAVRQPDGGYVLNGRKMWITNGSVADAAVVFEQRGQQHQQPLVKAGQLVAGRVFQRSQIQPDFQHCPVSPDVRAVQIVDAQKLDVVLLAHGWKNR